MKSGLGQLFFIGLEGPQLQKHEEDFIVKNDIGGVVLFSRNLEDPKQIFELTSKLQSLTQKQATKLPMFIGVDMEGGRVHRLKPPFTKWPALKHLGSIDSTSISFRFAQAMGKELHSVGINLDFAPCIDVLTNSKNEVIGDRSISSDHELVSKHSSALVRGYIKSEVLPCAKHFPGHGHTFADSHEELPVSEKTLDELKEIDLAPFQKAIRARIDLIMSCHILYKNIDAKYPATLSKIFIKELLKTEYRYKNLVITDDLDMKALRSHFSREDIPVLALNAGCDMLLYCNEPESHQIGFESVVKAYESKALDMEAIKKTIENIKSLKQKKLATISAPDFKESVNIIGHPEHLRLSTAIGKGEIPEDLMLT